MGIGDSGHNRGRTAENTIDDFLDFHVWHHLAADLAKAGNPISDSNKPVFVHGRNVTGHIPAVANRLLGESRLIEITEHDVRTFDQQQPRSEERRVGKECRSRWSPY